MLTAGQFDQFRAELTATLTGMLAGARDTEGLRQALAASAAAAEAVCAGRPCDCGPGCPHCCVLNVAILLPEGLVIADWLRQSLLSTDLDTLLDRLALHDCWVRGCWRSLPARTTWIAT